MAIAPLLITHIPGTEATDIALAMRWDLVAAGYEVSVTDDIMLAVFGPPVRLQATKAGQWTDAEFDALTAVAGYALDRARAEVQG